MYNHLKKMQIRADNGPDLHLNSKNVIDILTVRHYNETKIE